MADSGVVDRDGFELSWIREGEGMPLLVLGSARFYPRYFPAALREHFEIVFCDLRQWAPTPPGFDVSSITRDTYTADVDAILTASGLQRPIVAGQSQHGTMALEYAQRHPERLRGVAVVVPVPPPGSGDGLEPAEVFFERDATPERRAAHARNHARFNPPEPPQTSRDFVETFQRNDAQRWYDPSFDGSSLWDGVEPNIEVMGGVFAERGLGGFTLEQSDLPTFLALGRYDYRFPYYLWDEPRKQFTNLEYRLYERSGHNPPYEQPDEFTADLAAWANDL